MLEVNKIYCGDNMELLKLLDDNSLDSAVLDPPYELNFMSKKWDNTGIAYNVDLWKEVFRVLKPGAFLLNFGGTRTSHRMVCALEDAGFFIKENFYWVYSQGFPKSLSLQKQLLKRGYSEEETFKHFGFGTSTKPAVEPICMAIKPISEKSITDNFLKWGTGFLNINTSRISCADSIKINNYESKGAQGCISHGRNKNHAGQEYSEKNSTEGRWPSNFILECICENPESFSEEEKEPEESTGGIWQKSTGKPAGKVYKGGGTLHTNAACPCFILDQQSGERKSGSGNKRQKKSSSFNACLDRDESKYGPSIGGDTGGASRFFKNIKFEDGELEANFYYCSKAPPTERVKNDNGIQHVTVKPEKLISYLIQLVTPPDGISLDIFSGSGTHAVCSKKLGIKFIDFEINPEYVEIGNKRLKALEEKDIKVKEWVGEDQSEFKFND